MGRAATRDRPYGWGGRPQGIAPTDGEGGHKGSPLRMGRAATAATRDRPYGWGRRPRRPRGIAPTDGEGGHKGSPLRMGGRPQGIAPTDGEGGHGGHEGSPLRMGGRPQGIAPTDGSCGARRDARGSWRHAREDPHLNLPPQTGEEVGGSSPADREEVGKFLPPQGKR